MTVECQKMQNVKGVVLSMASKVSYNVWQLPEGRDHWGKGVRAFFPTFTDNNNLKQI